jgi:hypothetical protein
MFNSNQSKKSLKMPKGYSVAVNYRKTDNTMEKRKRAKMTNNSSLGITIHIEMEVVLLNL